MNLDCKFIHGNEINNSFYKAIYSGNLEKVSELIELVGLSYNTSWDDGYDLLLTAIKCKHVDVAKLLISKGCKLERIPNMVSSLGNSTSVLPLIVKQGIIELIRLVLGIDKNLITKTEEGDSLLHIAVSEGQEDIVRLLLEYGADVELRNSRGLTPLHIAATMGHVAIMEVMLVHGANVDSRDSNGKTSLYLSVSSGHTTAVNFLLKQGASINCKNKNGQTLLLDATSKGYLEIVKNLLAFGANVNEINSFGQTPLHIACLLKNEKMICTLLNAGADVNAIDSMGMVPCDAIVRKESHGFCIMEKPSVSYTLGRHMLILNVGGFHLNPKNNMFYNMFYNMYFNEITVGKMVLSSRSSVLQSIEEKCKYEISLMKTLRGDGGVTVYNTFKKLKNPLSVVTESEIRLIESINIQQQLPLYESITRSLLKIAKVRSELVAVAQEWFTFIISFSNSDLPTLPEEMSFQIVSCLSNSDLKQLIECGEKLSNQISTKGKERNQK